MKKGLGSDLPFMSVQGWEQPTFEWEALAASSSILPSPSITSTSSFNLKEWLIKNKTLVFIAVGTIVFLAFTSKER